MKKRIVVVKRRQPEPEPATEVVGDSTTEVSRFQNRIQELKHSSIAQERYIRDRYEEVVGERAGVKESILLIKKRVAYELMARFFTRNRKRLPERLAIQLKKARAMTFEAWEPSEISQMKLYAAAVSLGGIEMGKAKEGTKAKEPSAHKSKTSGVGVAEWYMSKFDENNRKKLSDRELANEFKKEFPNAKHHPDEKYIRFVRNVYNQGKLTPQKGNVPKTPCAEFDKDRKALGFVGRGSEEKNAKLTKAGIKFVPQAQPIPPKRTAKAAPAKKHVVVVKK